MIGKQGHGGGELAVSLLVRGLWLFYECLAQIRRAVEQTEVVQHSFSVRKCRQATRACEFP